MSQDHGTIEYNCQFNFARLQAGYQNYPATLHFNNKESLFIYRKGILVPGDKRQYMLKQYVLDAFNDRATTEMLELDTPGYMVYYQKFAEMVLARECLSRQRYLVNDTLGSPEWELLDSVKMIHDYTCKLAKTNYRGRVYFAWYSEAIPQPYGPWKLIGLPGFILDAYTPDRSITFSAKTIDLTTLPNFDRPKAETEISLMEYWNLYVTYRKDILQTLYDRAMKAFTKIGKTNILVFSSCHTSLEILGPERPWDIDKESVFDRF